MSRINQVDYDSADGETRAVLDGVKAKYGAVPNLLATVAHAPAALKGYLAFAGALADGVLDEETREAIALTLARVNECDYCQQAHAFASRGLKVSAHEIEQRLNGRSSDPKLNAILGFATAVAEKRGGVSDGDLAWLRSYGVSDRETSEIVANVVANIFTNYFNHVAETESDFPALDATLQLAA